MEKLRALNVQEVGSIAVSMPELVLSKRADKAEEAAPGDGRRRGDLGRSFPPDG